MMDTLPWTTFLLSLAVLAAAMAALALGTVRRRRCGSDRARHCPGCPREER